MKHFQVVQKNFAFLGINANQSGFNEKLVKTCLIYGLTVTSSVLFLFFEAKTFLEFTSNIYITTAIAVINAYFIIWILKLEKFFNLIHKLETLIEGSECFLVESN